MPMPGTEGGSSTNTKASRSENILPRRSPRILAIGRWRRSANGFSVTKITPVLGALVKVAPSKPTMPTAWATPSVAMIISEARRTSWSARSSVAPAGSCMAAIRYERSSCGTRPVGVDTSRWPVITSRPP